MKKIFLVPIILIFIVIFVYLKKDKNEITYKIGNDVISSMYKVTGGKESYSVKNDYENGINIKTLTFSGVNISNAVKYADYLWKNEGFLITENNNFGKENGSIELSKNSKELGKIIKLKLTCLSNETVIIALKLGEGFIKLKN